jgi:hypothetical protein
MVTGAFFININHIEGAYTNGKTRTCVSYNAVFLAKDRFVSIVNTPIDYKPRAWEIEIGRVRESPNGEYYIRHFQHGNYYITNDSNEKTITKVFANGITETKPFSKRGTKITIDGIELRRVLISSIYILFDNAKTQKNNLWATCPQVNLGHKKTRNRLINCIFGLSC